MINSNEVDCNKKRKIIVFLAVVFIIELFISFFIFPNIYFKEVKNPSVLEGDAGFYDNVSKSLVNGEGYSSNKIPTYAYQPGYPIFISFLYKIFGFNYKPVILIQYIMLLFSFLIVIYLANIIYKNNIFTLFVAICFILNYNILKLVGNYYSENLAILLVTFIVYLLFIVKNKNFIIVYIILGLLFGFLTLTRPIFEIFPFFVLIFSLIFTKRINKLFRKAFIFFIMFLIIIIPYIVRNWIIFDLPQINAMSGMLFYEATNVNHDGQNLEWEITKKELKLTKYGDINELSRGEVTKVYRLLMREGFKNILRNPLGFIILYFKNELRLLGWADDFPDSLKTLKSHHFYFLIHIIIFILFIIGFIKYLIIKSNYENNNLFFIVSYSLIIYYFILSPLFTGSVRFGAVIMPLIYLLSPFGLSLILPNSFLVSFNKKINGNII